ncbi:MAG: hypothetical protein FJX76_15520 [Armatimonadetes bacterium]|nr:hypothetical protein [Armatimonadota bacterium]
MAPALAQFEQVYKDKVQFVDINVDDVNSPQYQKYADQKETRSIPETMILKNGKVVFRKVGSMRFEDMKRAVDAAMK